MKRRMASHAPALGGGHRIDDLRYRDCFLPPSIAQWPRIVSRRDGAQQTRPTRGGETEPALFSPHTRVACCGARSVLDEAHLPFAKAPAAPRLWVTPALLGLANGGELLGGLGSQLFEVSCVAAGLRGDCAICNFGCCIWPWLPTGRWLLHLHVAVHRGRGRKLVKRP